MSRALPDHDISCVAHVHSTYSDGTATVAELLEAGLAAGVDALLLTDHDSLAARRAGWEGHHEGVFLLVGEEVSPRRGHYLAFGLGEEIPHAALPAAEIAADGRAGGGVGFAAHPFSTGGHMLVAPLARQLVRPHPWPALEQAGGTDGVELWSLTTDAAESWCTPAEAIRWLRDPRAAVASGPPARHLRIWDRLSSRRRTPAIGGLDGHQPGIRVGGRVRSPLSHERTFDLLRTHLVCARPVTGDVEADRATLLGALAGGAAWLCSPCVAPADGARFWTECPDGSLIAMGGEAEARGGVLRVRLPRTAQVLVFRDGIPIAAVDGARLDLDLDGPGVYRVEARVSGRFWLLSNPVHLRPVSFGRSRVVPRPVGLRSRP